MTQEVVTSWTVIDALIKQQQPFVMYRIPGEETPRFLTQATGNIRLIYDIKELNEKCGYVIAPFQVSEKCPIVLIQPDRFETGEPFSMGEDKTQAISAVHSDATSTRVENVSAGKDYAACFDTFIRALRDKTFDKLVLSRNLALSREVGFSPAAAFYKACTRYIYSYVYLCYTPQTGVWLGSTPEILLSGVKGEWNTVALAGTQSLQDGKLPQEWDDKNREEQEYVTSYIRHQLISLGIHPEENGPYPAFAGALAHLKTDFSFSLADSRGLGDLLKLLHPTPAICGLPKEEAYQFILRNEGYDRKYYSGFIGWLDPDGRTDLYVNLRCMNIAEDKLTLYAGSGLLASSELDDEWQETEKKLQTMKRIINYVFR